ncbi:MAG: hypothetical protein RL681_577 [Candidatus Parcubacteria bacterium]
MIFSAYPESAPITVWSHDYWISDAWDPLEYGRDYDWKRPFFEQFADLMREMPWPSLSVSNAKGSPYCNNATNLKDSYLVFGSTNSEDSYYGFGLGGSKNIYDGSSVYESELNYQGVFNRKCYRAFYSNHCRDSSDIYFCKDCTNVTNCFGCIGLKNKSHCIFNKQVTKEEYRAFMDMARLGSYRSVQEWIAKAEGHWQLFPNKYSWGSNNSGVSGEYLNNCKNVARSFAVDNGENLKYCEYLYSGTAKDCYDYFRFSNGSELVYETMGSGTGAARLKFCIFCFPASHSMSYCVNCASSSDLFGCFGLKNKHYCILNKQYTKEEYEKLMPRIIEHMTMQPYVDKRGRTYAYGEFFPPEFSPFAYNETIAQEYFPLSAEAAINEGYGWGDVAEKGYTATVSPTELPDDIAAVKDSVLKEVIRCEHDGKCSHPCATVFRIVPQELQFYRRSGIPLPRMCFVCRHYERMKYRRSFRLSKRRCMCEGGRSRGQQYVNQAKHSHGENLCPNEFETSYAPERPEIVYCESCYNAEVA